MRKLQKLPIPVRPNTDPKTDPNKKKKPKIIERKKTSNLQK